MADAKYIKDTTPVGKLGSFAKLVRPDEKFNKYSAKFILPADHPFIVATVKKVDEQAALALKEALANDKRDAAKKKAKPIKATANCPYENEADKDGNETGNVVLKFGLNPTGKKKDGTEYARKPKLFNSVGSEVKLAEDPWAGSDVSIAFTYVRYGNPAIGAGCSLQLNAVQLIKVVKGGQSAEGYGFGKHEGGFEGDDEDTPSEAGSEGGDASPAPAGDDEDY